MTEERIDYQTEGYEEVVTPQKPVERPVDTLSAFYKENTIKEAQEVYEVAISDRFVDPTTGEPIKWKIKTLTPSKYLSITNGTAKRYYADAGKTYATVDESDAIFYELIGQCVKLPNLQDVGLQESYGAIGVPQLIDKMLTSKEFLLLNNFITKIHNQDKNVDEMVAEAKN